MNYIIWAIINTIAALLAVYLIKQFTINHNFVYLIFASICYLVLMISYINMLDTAELSSVYPFLQIIQILAGILIGILIFKESITRNKIIGIIFGLISMYFLLTTI